MPLWQPDWADRMRHLSGGDIAIIIAFAALLILAGVLFVDIT